MYSDRNTTCNYMAGHGDNNSFCSIGGGGRDREHMFDKVVTPSDVGKLNRLVIPKQHAEKYFPLDSSTNEKGLILNFEDRNGKPWRFRYSYWNSSQSYVMTKGWSRFVKEKKLDAGDIVSFERGIGELGKDCLYIDFRRRVDTLDPSSLTPLTHPLAFSRLFVPRPGLLMHRNFDYSNYSGTYGYNAMNHGPVFYLNSLGSQPVGVVEQGGDLNMVQPMVFDSVPVVQCKVAPKRVRLFGVNLDCPMDEDSDLEVLSSPPMTVTNTSFSPHAQIESSRRTEGSLSLELNM